MARVLQLSSKFPLPADEGKRIATWNLSRCLRHNGYEIDLVCFGGGRAELATHDREMAKVFASVEVVEKDVERQYVADLLRALATGRSYFACKYNSTRVADLLRRKLDEHRYDVTLIEHALMGVYLPLLLERATRAGRIVLREHNVEYEILERMAPREGSLLKRALLRREARLFRAYERDLVRMVGDVRAISARDAEILNAEAGGGSVTVLDPFIDADAYAPSPAPPQPYRVVTVANLSWIPNANGVKWFCREVWPGVLRECPEATFSIVGKTPPAEVRSLVGPGVVVTGRVADERPYLEQARLFIVPLFEGSGVRIKILTALAMGKEVLATRLGAEGLDWPGKRIEEGARGWTDTILDCFRTPPRVMGETVAHVREKYHWKRSLTL